MSDKKENQNPSEKNISPIINNPNASQTIQGVSSIITDRINENQEQQNNIMNQLNSNPNPNIKSISTIQQSTAYPNSH